MEIFDNQFNDNIKKENKARFDRQQSDRNNSNNIIGETNMKNIDYEKVFANAQNNNRQGQNIQAYNDKNMMNDNNPFNNPDYQNIGTPDVPIQYGGGMAEILLSDKEVPDHLKKKYWWIFNKDNVLTFLDINRKQAKLRAFDTAVIDTMNTKDSYDDYTFAKEFEYGIMRNAFDIKMDRAVGTNTNNKNERIILQTQFSENKQVSEQMSNGAVRDGFFKRLLGRR